MLLKNNFQILLLVSLNYHIYFFSSKNEINKICYVINFIVSILDLKKLANYENSLVMKSEVKIQAGAANVNVRRLFQSENPGTSSLKFKFNKIIEHNGSYDSNQSNLKDSRTHKVINTDNLPEVDKSLELQTDQTESDRVSCHRKFSAESHRRFQGKLKLETKRSNENRNINERKQDQRQNNSFSQKSKGFIRPRFSSQSTTPKPKLIKTNDPVALYHSYQKDWTKFRSNICESSHSGLRWSVRERNMTGR